MCSWIALRLSALSKAPQTCAELSLYVVTANGILSPVHPITTYKPGNFCPVCGRSYLLDYWTDGHGNRFYVHSIVEIGEGQLIVQGCLVDDEVFRRWQESSDRTLAAIEADKAAARLRASDPTYRHRPDMG